MKDAYYFSHDSNAKDDPKCVMLIETLQLEGYGIFWMLVETLRDQPDYKYPLQLIPALARRYNTTSEKLKAVIMNFGLFEVEKDTFFYSESLIRRMALKDAIIKKRIKAGKISGQKRKQLSLEHKLNTCSTDAEQLKEKKRKEIKENKDIYGENDNVKLTEKEYQKCIDKHGEVITLQALDKLSNYKISKGKIYKSDYGALNTWVWDSIKEKKKVNSSEPFHVIMNEDQGINNLIERTYNGE